MGSIIRREELRQADRSKLIPHIDYLEKELLFLSEYEREIDWKVYQSQRGKRLDRCQDLQKLQF